MNKTSKVLTIGLLSVTLAHAVIACTDDPFSPESGREKITFTVLRNTFVPGDTIVATLVNRSDRDVGYNLCLAELDLQTPSGWQRIQRHLPDAFCTLVLLVLAPGQSAHLTQPVREEFPAGLYRFRAEVEWPLGENQRFMVTTGSFAIEE
jgi:hypothetical protein